MDRVFVCALLIGLTAFVAATKFSDCGSTTGEVTAVKVTDCPDGQDVCILKKGTKPTITIEFKSEAETKALKALVHGVIADVFLPFPIPQPNACKSGVNCPVKTGENYSYSGDFNVRKSYPAISARVRFELQDEKDSDMVCVEIPIKIQ